MEQVRHEDGEQELERFAVADHHLDVAVLPLVDLETDSFVASVPSFCDPQPGSAAGECGP